MFLRLLHRQPRLDQCAIGIPLRGLGTRNTLAGSSDGRVFGVAVQETMRLGRFRFDGLGCYGTAVEEGATATGFSGRRGLGGCGGRGSFVAATEETHCYWGEGNWTLGSERGYGNEEDL